MKIGIIGAGFGGLSAAYRLTKIGHDVSVFESEKSPGGLAIGFKEKNWKWSVERHYHHLFTNDDSVLDLAKEIGHDMVTERPKTSTFVGDMIYQLDSPINLLTFRELGVTDRFRTGVVLAYLKYLANWKRLEKVTAKEFLVRTMGNNSWKVLWEPLFEKKFDKHADTISAAWFWARIKKRTASLVYPVGGFYELAQHLSNDVQRYNGKIYYSTAVKTIRKESSGIILSTNRGDHKFDRMISTLPTHTFLKITKGLPKKYIDELSKLEGIGAINLLISLKHRFFEDNTYWLNVNKMHFPFVAVVEHTNFMDKKYYNNEHLIYIGNYLSQDHSYFRKDAIELIKEFYPFLKTINPKFDSSWIKNAYLFKDYFAQPIVRINYSQSVPSMTTPIDGLFMANMQQVYPWDRGTNYAIANGEAVAQLVVDR